MRTPLARIALAAVLLLALAACDSDEGGVLIVSNPGGGGFAAAFVKCPDCNDAVTLRSYGSFVFLGTDPVFGDALIARCGFVVSPAAPGSSTQVQGCSGGVEFAIVSGQFRSYRVRNGWRGRTDSGFGIGSSVNDVLAAQPGFVQVDDLTYLLDNGDVRAEANFASDRTLSELIVGRGFRR